MTLIDKDKLDTELVDNTPNHQEANPWDIAASIEDPEYRKAYEDAIKESLGLISVNELL